MRVFTLFCILFVSSLFAQDRVADSLKTILDNKIAENTDSLGISRAYFKLGRYLSYSDIKKSSEYLEKALAIAERLGNKKAAALISNVLAANLSDESSFNDAINLYEKCQKLFLELGDKSRAADMVTNIASSYIDLGDYQSALTKQFDALQLKISSGDSSLIASYYSSVAIIYDLLGNPEKHEEYILMAEKLIQNPSYTSFYITMEVYNQLGQIYEEKGNYNQALATYDKIFSASKAKNYLTGMTTALTNKSEVLKKTGKINEAIKNLKKAYSIQIKTGKNYNIHTKENRLAELYLEQKNYKEAKRYSSKALSFFEKNGYPEELQRTYLNIYKTEKAIGKDKQALSFLERYEILKDSLRSSDVHNKILEMDSKYQLSEKNKKIELLDKDKKIQEAQIARQNIIIASFVIFVILISILIYYLYKRKQEKLVHEKIDSQLKMLRAQLNPHFIFNSLNAIQNFILTNNPVKGADYLADFSRLMRLILDSSREETISLADEIELIDSYLALQKLRFKNSFEYKINNQFESDIKIPPMLTQPFIENAVEHGISKYKNFEGVIDINIFQNENKLQLEINDNGPGINSGSGNQIVSHKSHAIEITRERINGLNKQSKNYVNFEVIDLSTQNSNGTKVLFKINLN